MKVETPEFDLRVGLDQINGTHHPQEDSYAYGETPYGYYYVLADGMGGYGGGDVSSQAVVAAFSECMERGDSPETALSRANEVLAKVKKRKNLPPEAGCTLVAVTIDITKDGIFCSCLSVGDSYIYYCPADGPMRQVNPLHENEDGSLYSALQGGEIEAVFTAVNALELYPGDRLMLASDGVQAFGENKLRSLFRKYPVPPMQHQNADVIPGEAGDIVYRILHRLEEETEQGLQNDPEYYQDNTSVMIVEWPPAAQKSQGKAIAVKAKSRIILSRDRMLMAGVIVVLALVLCVVLFRNSGEVNKTVQNPAPDSQTAPQSQPATPQQGGTVAPVEELPDNVRKFEKALTADKVDYNAIVNAWAGLSDDQKQLIQKALMTWFYGKDEEKKFDCLMERCRQLAGLDNRPQADGMLAYLLEKEVQGIEELLPDSITENKLSLKLGNDDIPHFLLLDLLLATKADVNKDWLNWFVYEIPGLSDKETPWESELQEKVCQKALEVDPGRLLAAYNNKKGSASKSNVEALLGNPSFVESYSRKQKEWIKDNYNKDEAKAFCEPLMSCLIKKNENNGAELINLGLTVKTLEKEGSDFTAAKTALAAANLESALGELKDKKVLDDALQKVEEAYDVAKDNGVADFDEKVSTKVADLITKDNFKNEIYKKDRYLKPIWTNLLIGLVSEKKAEAKSLSALGLDVDKICKLLDKQKENVALKAALKTLIAEQMPYAAFKKLYSIAKKSIDADFAEDLVWQYFTTDEKLNAAKVTEYAKDSAKNSELMTVLVNKLIDKKDGGGTAQIKATDLMDYDTVKKEDFCVKWEDKDNITDEVRVYMYMLLFIPETKLNEWNLGEETVNNIGEWKNAQFKNIEKAKNRHFCEKISKNEAQEGGKNEQ